ncbi:MAG: hypothetical protein Q8P19_00030 [bacterium]|nr:hypothetical protein [bacterium]
MKNITYIFLLAMLLSPISAGAQETEQNADTGATPSGAAYQFKRQGIFDCNQNGSYAMSVGALSAIGGAYVPVADSAVELNTGTIVYKECVLREVVNRERESALSALLKQIYTAIQKGRNGNPLYVQNYGQEILDVSDRAFLYGFLQGTTLTNLNPALQAPITRALAQYYYGERKTTQTETLTCPYQGDLRTWWNGQDPFSLSSFWKASQPQCDAIIAYHIAENISIARHVTPATEYQQIQWDQGRGFYSGTDNAQNPLAERIMTPSSVIEQSFEQLLQSPVQQLQSANDIGQMIGALYSGVTTQIVGDERGLAGLGQSVGGQPSYIDQVAAESAAGVRGAAANIALQILAAAQQIEQAYFSAVDGIAQTLIGAISQLRSAETQCWNLIIPKVCTSSLSSSNTCKGAGGISLKVATSTVFSQTVVGSQIRARAEKTSVNIDASKQALGLIGTLIEGVTNTTSLNAQRIALQQLDTLVHDRKLHTQPDLQGVMQELAGVRDLMTLLVEDTVEDWADGTSAGGDFSASNRTGWCNVQDQTTLDTWTSMWKQ